MNEDQLRAMVRTAIMQHSAVFPAAGQPMPAATTRLHASHAVFATLTDGASEDGPCVIEPAVMCNHCGYCKSYGH